MFSIETTEDVKILKELTGFSNDMRIKELELQVQKLSQANEELSILTKEQKKVIDTMGKNLVTADQCREIVLNLFKSPTKEKVPQKNLNTMADPNEEFSFTNAMQKKFNKIIVEGNKLIHYTVRNQRMDIPISTIELLALVEVYQKRHRKLLNKDSKNICKLYGINKVQFGKLYYNIKQGSFFNTLDEINNQIRKANFKLKNGTIHLVDGANLINTKVDPKMFNQLLNIYVNSNQPYSAIYKLSREKSQIDPIHILILLRKNTVVSQTIIDG